MNNNYTVKQYSVPLYGGMLVVAFHAGEVELDTLFDMPDGPCKLSYGHSIRVNVTGDDGKPTRGHLVVFNTAASSQLTYGTLVHECLHAAYSVLEYAGVEPSIVAEEAYAYLIDWIADRVIGVAHAKGLKFYNEIAAESPDKEKVTDSILFPEGQCGNMQPGTNVASEIFDEITKDETILRLTSELKVARAGKEIFRKQAVSLMEQLDIQREANKQMSVQITNMRKRGDVSDFSEEYFKKLEDMGIKLVSNIETTLDEELITELRKRGYTKLPK